MVPGVGWNLLFGICQDYISAFPDPAGPVVYMKSLQPPVGCFFSRYGLPTATAYCGLRITLPIAIET
jgi:hypothetical protein